MSQIELNEFTVLHHAERENESFVACNNEEAPYISFPCLDKFTFLRHGFSTKLGGVSKGIYESMNVGFGRGDLDENVLENYRRLCKSLEIPEQSLVFTDQIHKDVIQTVHQGDCGKGIFKPKTHLGVDGHITNEPGVGLLVFSADCVPILYVDPIKKVIGATHSGWRGTVLKIAGKTVDKMVTEFGCDKSNIVAVIGPCICKKCYEVSNDVAEKFKAVFPKEQWDLILEETKPKEKYQLDLWKANRIILKDVGLSENNIINSNVCTMCHSDLLFSHRATKGERGSMAGIIYMVKDDECIV